VPGQLLSERVYYDIKRDILTGLYEAGAALSVDAFVQKHHLSRTPVRDALNRLQHEGLVTAIPRVGYFVTQVTVKDVQDIFQLRAVLEAASAEMAARNITNEQLLQLEQTLTGYDAGDFDSYFRFLEGNREFHYRVALASGNRLLAEEVGQLLDRMQRLLFLKLDRRPAGQMVHEHHELISALRQRDPVLARKCMLDAVEDAWRAALEAIIAGADLPVGSPEQIALARLNPASSNASRLQSLSVLNRPNPAEGVRSTYPEKGVRST